MPRQAGAAPRGVRQGDFRSSFAFSSSLIHVYLHVPILSRGSFMKGSPQTWTWTMVGSRRSTGRPHLCHAPSAKQTLLQSWTIPPMEAQGDMTCHLREGARQRGVRGCEALRRLLAARTQPAAREATAAAAAAHKARGGGPPGGWRAESEATK